MAYKSEPSPKGGDTDFKARQLRLSTTATCTCTCGHGDGVGQGGPTSPIAERMLHQEPQKIAASALERRIGVISRVLLPQVKELARALAKANEEGAIGPGELQILATLQCWILQLQIEEDELRLVLPPALEPKAT
jgi:hypothetical protein